MADYVSAAMIQSAELLSVIFRQRACCRLHSLVVLYKVAYQLFKSRISIHRTSLGGSYD